MDFSFIFVGGTHGFVDDFKKQKEVILPTMPEFVLCEDLEDNVLDSKEKLKEIINKKEISNMTSFEDAEKLIMLCLAKNIKLIGIDFHNFGFNENLQKKIKNQDELSEDEDEQVKEILIERGNNQIKCIKEYHKKSTKPIVVIVGAWHLREDSKLIKSFDRYKVIFPCDEKGNLVLEPINEKIVYCEKTKNG